MKEKVTLPSFQKTKDSVVRKKAASITARLLRRLQ